MNSTNASQREVESHTFLKFDCENFLPDIDVVFICITNSSQQQTKNSCNQIIIHKVLAKTQIIAFTEMTFKITKVNINV